MKGLYFEKDEVVQIVISVLAISFGFALVFASFDGMMRYPAEFLFFMILSLVTVGSGFILHEMAHKLVAIYYGAYARFQMWTQGLIVMLITSFFGMIFAAPGAVYIYSNKITVKQNGLISVAGPLVNLTLVAVFMGLAVFMPKIYYLPFIAGKLNVWAFGAKINLILALFNMIPAFPLDGSKVFFWNKLAWVGVTALLVILGMQLISPFIVISWGILMVIALVFSKLAFG